MAEIIRHAQETGEIRRDISIKLVNGAIEPDTYYIDVSAFRVDKL